LQLLLPLAAVRGRILSSLVSWSAERLRRADLDVPQPEGGFYVYPSFSRVRPKLTARGIRSNVELTERLLQETGISSLPGRHFGNDDASLHVRLALVDFDGARALSAARGRDVDEAFLRRYCSPIYEAIHALADWTERL
jgi:aspartate aminotransferase